MKAKSLIQLLSLSTSLYMISKDEALMHKLAELTKKGKDKLNELYDDFSKDEEEQFTDQLLKKAREAREEIEKKIEESVEKLYTKMHIAHTGKIADLELRLEALQKELALAEARIVNLEMDTL